MLEAKNNPNADYDDFLGTGVDGIKQHISSKNDDHLILLVGDTGSGKSNLALHIMDRYMGAKADTKFIGLNQSSIARAIKHAKDAPMPRFVLMDESNINKRDSLSRYNKQLMDLFLAVRGLNIFWVWCNPSLDMMDKFFVKERISSVILVVGNYTGQRPYYFFPKKNILTILQKYGSLDINLLKKVRGKYAHFRGWFKQYKGALLDSYLSKKDSRMDEKVEQFFQEWGDSEDTFNGVEVCEKLGISKPTVNKYYKELLKEGLIVSGEHFVVFPSGRIGFKEPILEIFTRKIQESISNQRANLKRI